MQLGELPLAKVLDVILYSREQIVKEHAAMSEEDDGKGRRMGGSVRCC